MCGQKWSKSNTSYYQVAFRCILENENNNFVLLSSRIISFFIIICSDEKFMFVYSWFVYEKRYKLDFYCSKNFPKGLIVSTLLMNLDKNKNEFSPRVPS